MADQTESTTPCCDPQFVRLNLNKLMNETWSKSRLYLGQNPVHWGVLAYAWLQRERIIPLTLLRHNTLSLELADGDLESCNAYASQAPYKGDLACHVIRM